LLTGGDGQCNGASGAGERLSAWGNISVKVATNNAIPAGATAAILNVTAVNPGATGYLTVYPQGAAQPFTATVNYTAGQITGNRVIVPLSTNGATPGDISIFSSSAADLVVDVSGHYSVTGGQGVASPQKRLPSESVTPGRGTLRASAGGATSATTRPSAKGQLRSST
jgi:hypothetical protein